MENNSRLHNYNIDINFNDPLSYIYKITHKTSGKCYIGQTKNIQQRLEQHLSGQGSKPLLQDLVKYGISEFSFDVIDQIFDLSRDVDALEDGYIEKHDCLFPNGYNLRFNRSLCPTEDISGFDNIQVSAKFVFSDGIHAVFSIGEFTQSRSYQTLLNLKNSVSTNMLRKKKTSKFKYLELRIDNYGERKFEQNTIYQLAVEYSATGDYFQI